MSDKRCTKGAEHCGASPLWTPAQLTEFAGAVAERVAALLEDRPKCARGWQAGAKQAEEAEDSLALSYEAAGKLLGVTGRTVFSLCQNGTLRAVSIGRARRVVRSSIDEFLKGSRQSE